MVGLKKFNILFLEDNEEFAKNTGELISIYFKKIYHTDTIKKAKQLFERKNIHIVISDIKLHNTNGLEFIKFVRNSDVNIPIIIITAFKDENFLLQAIPLNISSYQLKPLSYNNFMSIIELLSKKLKSEQTIDTINNIEFNIYTKEIFKDKKYIDLSKKESIFLDLLFKNKNRVITYELMQENVWENKFVSSSAIKNFILRLRKKIDKDFISTVNGVGYRLSF